jgi:hypothetical protein
MGSVFNQGHVVNGTGKPVRFQPVQLTVGGRTYRTATNANGDYRFFALRSTNARSIMQLPATAQLSIKGVTRPVSLRGTTPVQVRIP